MFLMRGLDRLRLDLVAYARITGNGVVGDA